MSRESEVQAMYGALSKLNEVYGITSIRDDQRKPAGDTGRHVEPAPRRSSERITDILVREISKARRIIAQAEGVTGLPWPHMLPLTPDYDTILLAARKRREAENNYLEEPSARDLHEPIDGRNLFRALSVPEPCEGSLHDRVMPYRGYDGQKGA